MPDREKAITDAEEAIEILSNVDEPTPWCDFVRASIERALELLKEQEDGTMFIYDDYYTPMCQKCGFHPFIGGYTPTIEWMKDRGYKVCPHCGRAVNWNG